MGYDKDLVARADSKAKMFLENGEWENLNKYSQI